MPTATDAASAVRIYGPDVPPPATRHYGQLDSLRGVAALIVVFGHYARLTDESLFGPRVRMLHDVLLPLINGTASVIVFFLLSGFVLSLPYKRRKEQPYGTFFLRRVARIYLPYLAALALAVFADWRLHRPLEVSPWFTETWTTPLTPSLILQHVFLIGNYDIAAINTAFWSLAVEMRLSILFPLLCIPLMRWRKGLGAAILALLTMTNYFATRLLVKHLDPVSMGNLAAMMSGTICFAAGILVARYQESIHAFWCRLSASLRAAFFLASFVALEWGHTLKDFHLWALTEPVTIAGGCGLLVVALCSGRVSQLLHHASVTWLGKISYSLYLVHATVLFALVYLLFGPLSRLQLLLPYLVLALLAAAGFYALVESPSIRLSRSIGRKEETAKWAGESG